MAKAQQRGLDAVTIMMVAFVFLWLATTVLTVILYTGREQLVADNQTLRTEKSKVISANEERSIGLAALAREGGPTVVGLMEQERSAVVVLATGTASDTSELVKRKLDDLVGQIAADGVVDKPGDYEDLSLLEIATQAYQELKSTREQLTLSDERTDELEQNVNQLFADREAEITAFKDLSETLSSQFEEGEEQRKKLQDDFALTATDLESTYDARERQLQADLTKEQQDVGNLRTDLATLRERLQAQQAIYTDVQIKPGELITARQPDGSIVFAIPGDDDNMVYIDLGGNDHLTLGLQFTVYSRETGIPPHGGGKAAIEVVRIFESSAECRVLQYFGNQIVFEGDLIANPVYDRDRAMTFVVAGEFDLDYDGEPDLTGADTIGDIVKTWGGTVAEELTAITDFVVLGSAPPRPRAAASDATAAQRAQTDLVSRRYDAYQQVIADAQTLAVPVMTQGVFLRFLGQTGPPGP